MLPRVDFKHVIKPTVITEPSKLPSWSKLAKKVSDCALYILESIRMLFINYGKRSPCQFKATTQTLNITKPVSTHTFDVFQNKDGIQPIGRLAPDLMKRAKYKIPHLTEIEGFNATALTDEMRLQAYSELNRNIASQAYPYRQANRTLWFDGQPIFRTNHNGTNMLRQVKHTEDFIKHLLTVETEFSALIKDNPQMIQEIKLGAYFSSLGRLNEGSWKDILINVKGVEDNPTITAYASSKIYRKVADDIGLADSKMTPYIEEGLRQNSCFDWAEKIYSKNGSC